jgi:hypothetical protein
MIETSGQASWPIMSASHRFRGLPGLKAARGIGTPEARFFVSGVGVETGIS